MKKTIQREEGAEEGIPIVGHGLTEGTVRCGSRAGAYNEAREPLRAVNALTTLINRSRGGRPRRSSFLSLARKESGREDAWRYGRGDAGRIRCSAEKRNYTAPPPPHNTNSLLSFACSPINLCAAAAVTEIRTRETPLLSRSLTQVLGKRG